jgi:NAD(P)-dependent dehydrogenase (short-subunit alcohol dehydrogenase family)
MNSSENSAEDFNENKNENKRRIALITGANRGLGLELARQLAKSEFITLIGVRDEQKGLEAQQKLKQEGLTVAVIPLDVTNAQSIEAAAETIAQTYGKLNILVNNAGILPDEDSGTSATLVDPKTILRVFETNTLGPLQVTQAMLKLLKRSPSATIVNISSGLGALTDMEGGYPAYRISKVSLNAITRMLAAELSETSILVHSVCPGWVQTDMGGPNAARTPQDSVAGILPLLLKPHPELNGRFVQDGKPIAW